MTETETETETETAKQMKKIRQREKRKVSSPKFLLSSNAKEVAMIAPWVTDNHLVIRWHLYNW